MQNYDHKKIEKKWQKEWNDKETYKTLNPKTSSFKATAGQSKKMYVLDMFPYPSGVGLHVGHPRGYIGSDVYARMKRMQGYNVLHPMGYDAFGLPAEQYALEHKIHPKKAVEENIKTFRKQLSIIGLSYDWSRVVNTTDPKYFKWTQWIFLEIYNSWFDKSTNNARDIKELELIFNKEGNKKVNASCSDNTEIFSANDWNNYSKKEKQDILMKYRLAYEGYSEVNWCEHLGTVLANDEIVNDEKGNLVSERGGYPVEKKSMRQWFMRITAYADRLLNGLEDLEWSDHIKSIQKNWIGKSEGGEIEFKIKNKSTTRFILLHGRQGSPSDLFFPWLKENLEKSGCDVVVPKLPNAAEPDDEEQTKYILEKYKNLFNENTIIIGHSSGGIVAMRLLEEGIKVQEVILIAAVFSGKFIDGRKRTSVTLSAKKGFNFNKIRKQANNFKVLADEKDTIVPLQDAELFANNLGTKVVKCVSNIGHFLGKEEPSILENIFPKIKVFTTRADTLFGATYVVLAPEHPLITNGHLPITNEDEVNKYIEKVKNKTDEDRTKNDKEKTGVELNGIMAINPANGEEIPIWVADYVLASYGTGAVMAVPAHDERDFEFAKKYELNIKEVVMPREGEPHEGAEYRKTISVVIHRKRDDKYLMLKWNDNLGWISPSIGGVEDGEEISEASVREVLEETGYRVRFIERLGGVVESHFFAKNKNVWRFRHDYPVLCELVDENLDPEDVSAPEKKLHSVLWMSSKEALEKISHEYNKIGLRRYLLKNYSFIDYGYLINSGKFDGMTSREARNKITEFVGGKMVTKYKMRDAIFARQRYWGEPIPLRHDPDGIITQLKEKDLPLELPNVKSYSSQGTGESPLAGVKSWVKEGYETNTMPGWAGSSWYFLRYMDPQNSKNFASKKAIDYWKNVDMYVGGAEHATGHLLYSRFWNNFLYDMGYVPFKEPFQKMKNIGMVLATDGRKMSKRWNNVINPDDIVKNYGADTLRVYEMFMGPFEQSLPWSTESIIGSRRFIEKVYRVKEKINENKNSIELEKILHKTIKKVSEDIENFAFNTAISSMMILVNEIEKYDFVNKNDFKLFLQILSPFAPHITEELWSQIHGRDRRIKSIHLSSWPKWNENKIIDQIIKIAVQVNGKVRAEIEIEKEATENQVKDKVLKDENILNWIQNKEIKRIIYVPGRILNIVV